MIKGIFFQELWNRNIFFTSFKQFLSSNFYILNFSFWSWPTWAQSRISLTRYRRNCPFILAMSISLFIIYKEFWYEALSSIDMMELRGVLRSWDTVLNTQSLKLFIPCRVSIFYCSLYRSVRIITIPFLLSFQLFRYLMLSLYYTFCIITVFVVQA